MKTSRTRPLATSVVGGAALSLAFLVLAGCGNSTTADGREIKVRPKNDTAQIDPPEKAMKDGMTGKPAADQKPR